ncbi:MAG: peptide deformylase [Phycisphaerales bacterium]|nr:peptide deformylase [Phycisphaerales bacterium]
METPRNILPIRLWPDPVLGGKAKPVEAFTPELAALAEQMIETMYEADGVGLAAPQVGHAIRMFVADPRDEDERSPVVFVNPEIHLEGELDTLEEGCLSIPEIRVQVRRPGYARVKALDLEGNPFEVDSDDFPARVWQHEFDHLDGVLIIDRMNPKDRLTNRKALKALKLAAEGS